MAASQRVEVGFVRPLPPLQLQVYQRVQKHLAATSPYLVDQVWDK